MTPKRIALVATNWPELELYCPNWTGMQKGLDRLGIPYRYISARPRFNPQEVIEYQPDLVIYGLMEILYNRDNCLKIRRALPEAKIVFWYGDLRNESTGHHAGDYSKLIDAMFVSNDAQEEFWKRHLKIPAVHYLPLGCEPLDKPMIDPKFNLPFIFVGGINAKPAFVERAMFINEMLGKSELKIISSYMPELRKKVFQAMPAIYGSAKVVLDVSHFTHIKGYTSNRFFIIPAMWGFALTKRFPGCEELYPEDTRVYFDTADEALEKMRYYLTHEKERAAIVAKGHEWSYNHSYDKRFKKMFSLL